MSKIIITGATSMLGVALTQAALARGIAVLALARKDSARRRNLPESPLLTVQDADLADYRDTEIAEKYAAFFHLAWAKTAVTLRDDVDTQLENIQYTLDAARLAKRAGCAVFVGAGSQAEYGAVTAPLTPATPTNPQSGYGIAKYTAGKLSRLLCAQLGLRHNWVRILSVFGKHDAPHTLIMYALNELSAGRAPEFTKCEQTWDYLYADDAAQALLAIAENGADGKTYPLGSGKPRQLSAYLSALKNIVKPDGVLQFGKKDYYPHQPMYLVADIAELTADTGWRPKTSFEDGIRKMLKTY